MKILPLTILVSLTCISVLAQHTRLKPDLKSESPLSRERIDVEPIQSLPILQNNQLVLQKKENTGTDLVSIVTLGSSSNVYSCADGAKSQLYLNSEINTITFFHRMGGSLDPGGNSGDLGYDISTDGGITWSIMNECYRSVNQAGGTYYTDAARYPNHGIYNPAGNTNPNNAYVTYFAPTLDGSNSPGSWGGYAYGRAKIGASGDTLRHLKTSRPGDGVYQYIPEGYCVTNNGEVWIADINQNWTSGTVVYQNSLIINHGTWNSVINDFVYQETLINCQTIDGSRPAGVRIEFAPDGITGYIIVLADNGQVPISAGNSYFPIMYKTTNGGQTWSGQSAIPLAGPSGISAVKNFLSDIEISEIFLQPLPSRDEILFTTAFDFDLSIDKWGNPHIAVIVGVAGDTPYSIIAGQAASGICYLAAMDITSQNGGSTWMGYNCGRTHSFRGTFNNISEDNRVQITTSPDRTKMFVSWIDTYYSGISDNIQPDIWCRGIDLITHNMTMNNGENMPKNVTENSAGMAHAFFATASQCAFESNGTFTIPFVYLQMNSSDPSQPVLYKYIKDFEYSRSDFPPSVTITPTNQNVAANSGSATFSISSNTTWSVSDNASWLAFSPATGSNDGILTVTYGTNNTLNSRVATLTIAGTGVAIPVAATVVQSTQTLSVTPAYRNVSAFQGTCTFTVTSNSTWNVSSNQTWCSVTPSGNGNGTITASFNTNSAAENRVATITVSTGVLNPITVVVNQAGTINQNDILNLLAGWNLISLDVIPTPATPEAVFATLISASNLELVTGFQNQMGVFFDPAGLPFLNTLTGLVPGEGYWVKVTNETTLNVTGEVIPPTFAINIKAGWNLVAYWLDETTTPEAAFADLITAGKLLLVTGYEQGGKFYDPNGLPFLNTLTEIKNGFGYWVKMSGDFNGFSYPITWSCGDQLVDIRDGKTYETLPIGTQCWMKQNLNIGIRIAGTSTQTNNGTIEKYCYNNSESNCNVYGGLYQWNEMMQYSTFEGVQGICPTGWHVPTDAEWTVLSTYLGGETVAGGKMKTTGTIEAGTGLWYSPNTGATNESGFSGLPAGGYYSGSFSDQGSYSDFWSATQYSSGGSWGRYLDCSNGALARGSYSQSNGLSVRCLKD